MINYMCEKLEDTEYVKHFITKLALSKKIIIYSLLFK